MCLTAMAWDAARKKGRMNSAGSQIHIDREVQEQCLVQLWLCLGFRTALKYREEGFYGTYLKFPVIFLLNCVCFHPFICPIQAWDSGIVLSALDC